MRTNIVKWPTLFAILLCSIAVADFVETTATGGGMFSCRVDGIEVSRHAQEYKAASKSVNLKLKNPDSSVVCDQHKTIVANLTAAGRLLVQSAQAQDYPGAFDSGSAPPNNQVIWNSTPNPSTVEGVGGFYDLLSDAGDNDGDTITCIEGAGSATLPDGVTLNSNCSFTDIGTGTAGTTAGIIVEAVDAAGTNIPVDSPTFSYVITAASAWVAHTPTNTVVRDMAGFGMDWSTYLATDPDYQFLYIDNLLTSGAGSFNQAMIDCDSAKMTFVVARTSGMIPYSPDSSIISRCNNLAVGFQWAPPPGLHVRGLDIDITEATRQLWMHYSCFVDATTQATGKCLDIQDGTPDITQILVINGGVAFAYDGGFSIFDNTTESTFAQTLSVYPLKEQLGQIFLIGHQSGDTNNISLYRNVGTHGDQRCPRWQEVNGIISNEVCFNGGKSQLAISNVSQPTEIDITHSLFIWGANTTVAKPLRFGTTSFSDDITAALTVYLTGNRSFGQDDSTQLVMTQDYSDGNLTLVGSPQSVYPPGYAATPIGAGDAGEQAFAELVCSNAGPRPTDRLAIYQEACDQITAEFNGQESGQHITTVSQHPTGYPTVAENTCDPSIADDCGIGFPVLPIGDPKGADTFIDKTWTAWMDMHCEWMPPGASGCP